MYSCTQLCTHTKYIYVQICGIARSSFWLSRMPRSWFVIGTVFRPSANHLGKCQGHSPVEPALARQHGNRRSLSAQTGIRMRVCEYAYVRARRIRDGCAAGTRVPPLDGAALVAVALRVAHDGHRVLSTNASLRPLMSVRVQRRMLCRSARTLNKEQS